MSKEGRIGNRALLKRLADGLEMEGVNRMPSDLNRDQVLAVVPLQLPEPFVQFEYALADNLTGVNVHTQTIPGSLTDDRRFVALNFDFGSANAAAAALPVRFQLGLSGMTSGPFSGLSRMIVHMRPWAYIPASPSWYFNLALGGFTMRDIANALIGSGVWNWDGFVPAGWDLFTSVASIDGAVTNFPNATFFNTQVLAVQVLSGRRFTF